MAKGLQQSFWCNCNRQPGFEKDSKKLSFVWKHLKTASERSKSILKTSRDPTTVQRKTTSPAAPHLPVPTTGSLARYSPLSWVQDTSTPVLSSNGSLYPCNCKARKKGVFVTSRFITKSPKLLALILVPSLSVLLKKKHIVNCIGLCIFRVK